ncbi:MAG: tetratricopeptide repeat protein [Acidobacteriota bacterium]
MQWHTVKNSLAVIFIFGLIIGSGLAQQPPSAAMADANKLFQEQKWAEAINAYQEIVKNNPTAGQAWYRLAYSLHATGKYQEAVAGYQKVLSINSKNAQAMYNLACAYSRLNEKDQAIDWLNKAINGGFPQLRAIKDDQDFDNLRNDARFQEALLTAAKIATPCLVNPEYKQFDFWVGEWEVFNPQGQRVGSSVIQKVTDGCIILENWSDTVGGSGKSLNFYNPETHKWYQKWVGSGGNITEFEGIYQDRKLLYESFKVNKDGSKVLTRMTFFDLGSDKVRQFWEQSTDEGKTWSPLFDGTYIRKKTAP